MFEDYEVISLENGINKDNINEYIKIDGETLTIIKNPNGNINDYISDNDKNNIKKIDILEPYEYINFSHLKNLEEVILPNGLGHIESGMFEWCTNLKRIELPNSVKDIGNNAFKNTGLREISLPESLEIIGKSAFEGSNLENIDLSKTKVRNIYDNAFKSCKKLKEIKFSDNTSYIGKKVFEDTNVENIDLSNTSLETISEFTFGGCEELKSVQLPEGVEKIKEGAFRNCIKLENINFPESLQKEEDAFENCPKDLIKSIPISIKTIDESNCKMDKIFCEDIHDGVWEIPEGIKEISFKNRYIYGENDIYDKIKEINFPSSMNKIGANVIAGFKNLKKVKMNDNVKSISMYNFYKCPNLKQVRFSRNLSQFFYEDNIYIDSNIRSSYLTSLCNVDCLIMPDSVENSKEVFKELFIDKGANYVNDNVKKIIYSKEAVSNFDFKYDRRDDNRYDYSEIIMSNNNETNIKLYDIHNKNNAFQNTLIENNYKNNQLEMSDIKNLYDKNNVVISSAKIKKIGPFAYSQCPNLESVIIEEGIKEIGPGAFAECENLKEIKIPKSVERISEYAFYGCQSLKHIEIPGKKCIIGNEAFSNCESIEWAILPKVVSEVGNGAFRNCENLNFVQGMDIVKRIGNSAFEDCNKLHISLPKYVEEIGNAAYCNCGTKPWDEEILETFPDFDKRAIIIPRSLKKIGYGAFYNCSNIYDVSFESDSVLKEIPILTFKNCEALEFIELPECIEKINEQAFYGCSSLNRVFFPKNINSVGEYAFGNCKNLKSVVHLGNDKTINICDLNAFEGSNNVEHLNLNDLNVNSSKMVGDKIFEIDGKQSSKFSFKGLKNVIKEKLKNNNLNR